MNKRLIVCCDGTWQKIDSPYPTNVAKLVQAIPAIYRKSVILR
ncbi:phospholipase effector Tle1 domain-containing protein [Chamaesiphon sp. OTE_8_metabat_110]